MRCRRAAMIRHATYAMLMIADFDDATPLRERYADASL